MARKRAAGSHAHPCALCSTKPPEEMPHVLRSYIRALHIARAPSTIALSIQDPACGNIEQPEKTVGTTFCHSMLPLVPIGSAPYRNSNTRSMLFASTCQAASLRSKPVHLYVVAVPLQAQQALGGSSIPQHRGVFDARRGQRAAIRRPCHVLHIVRVRPAAIATHNFEVERIPLSRVSQWLVQIV